MGWSVKISFPHLDEGNVAGAFAGDNVPLLGRGDEHVGGHDLGLGQLHVARQLLDRQPEWLEPRDWEGGVRRTKLGVCIAETRHAHATHRLPKPAVISAASAFIGAT